MRVIFFGTPDFSAKVLTHLLNHQQNIVAIVTKPDKPKGRSGAPLPTPVKVIGASHLPPIPVFQPDLVSAPEFAPTLAQFHPDLFVVVAYGEMIKQHLLDMPTLGCINMHTSLLPKYRGAAPIQHAIMAGEEETGVTIMRMVKKMDAGEMIDALQVPIGPNDIFPMVEEALCRAGSALLLQVMQQIEKGVAQSHPQDHALATYAPKIELEDCEIDWKLPAARIHNLVRAVTPAPGAWCFVWVKGEKKRLKIYQSAVIPELVTSSGKARTLSDAALVVECGENMLSLLDIQLEGKKRMTAQDLMRGLPLDALSFRPVP